MKESVSIPVFANGGIEHYDDVQKCLDYTGCDAVMSSEALLEYPALFSGKFVTQEQLTHEYLDLCEKYPLEKSKDKKVIKKHLFQFLYAGLQNNTNLHLHKDMDKMDESELDKMLEKALQNYKPIFDSKAEVVEAENDIEEIKE